VILSGAGVRAGAQLEKASILDLAPTILHALELAVPRDLDGRVLSEAFEETSPVARPVTHSEANVYKDGISPSGLSDEEMEEVQEKLRGWGYAG
jgi:arylsulfatase A-like enzyme